MNREDIEAACAEILASSLRAKGDDATASGSSVVVKKLGEVQRVGIFVRFSIPNDGDATLEVRHG